MPKSKKHVLEAAKKNIYNEMLSEYQNAVAEVGRILGEDCSGDDKKDLDRLEKARAKVEEAYQKIDDWKQVGTWPIDSWNDELKRNFQRNSKLIDLSLIPDEIKNNIYKCWNEKYDNTRSKILPYFMKHRLRELTERLGDF